MININLKEKLTEKGKGFFKLFKFTTNLPKEQSYMLSYLIDAEDFVDVRLKKDTEYFQCTNDFIKGALSGWSDAEINNAIQKLEDKGIISTIKISIKCEKYMQSRFIKLNEDVIMDLADENIADIDSDIVVIRK